MCGIAGVYGSFEPAAKQKALSSLSKCLVHRGPDGKGLYEDEQVALVHARLSIIDLSEQGNQPLYNEDRSLVLVCNGEIYNYKQLTQQLVQRGHKFSSHSDCETILHLYEEHYDEPQKMLEQLTGMFAFALWDIKRKRLLVARDRIGIKPLYYTYGQQKFIFASEVKPIADSGLFTPHIDPTSLFEYFLLRSIPAPNTLFEEVKCLEPGYYLTIEDGRITTTQYWDIPMQQRRWKNEQQVTDEVEALLSEAVKDHLVADVPVGTFLSAGVDSSLITSIAAQHHPGIHSFTAAFPGEPEDEGEVARHTANVLKTTHHAFALEEDFFTDFNAQFRNIDQPFAIPSALSLGCIAKLARQHVKVVLSGDGGDELFGGYGRYQPQAKPKFLKAIPGPMQDNMLWAAAKITRKKGFETLRQNLQAPLSKQFLERIQMVTPETALSMLHPDMLPKIDIDRFLRRLYTLFEGRKDKDALNKTLYVDFKTTLVDEMLTKCDRMTMMNGVEGRVPLLDHRLVELGFSIPHQYKRQNNTGKIVLRKILAKRLGEDLAYRVKTGFNNPLQQWLAKDPKTATFVKKQVTEAAALPFVNKEAILPYAQDPAQYSTNSIYPLVCLNRFFHREAAGTDK
ncbi:MAG: asparagine synthase (glutamine-hydrolyzing) [Bacteroidota bacterium]